MTYRVESLMSARLFVVPQYAGKKIYFLSQYPLLHSLAIHMQQHLAKVVLKPVRLKLHWEQVAVF